MSYNRGVTAEEGFAVRKGCIVHKRCRVTEVLYSEETKAVHNPGCQCAFH